MGKIVPKGAPASWPGIFRKQGDSPMKVESFLPGGWKPGLVLALALVVFFPGWTQGAGNSFLTIQDSRKLALRPANASLLLAGEEAVILQPLSMALGLLDGDFVPDLICGYAMGDKGMLAIYKGKAAAFAARPRLHGQAPFGTEDEAFSATPITYPLHFKPDFLGVGDFDNDGVMDIIAAEYGGCALFIIPGDGKGNLRKPVSIALPGALTALAVGEMNRRDHLTDIVAAVRVASDDFRVLIFESPRGALLAQPETFVMPGEVSFLEVGRFDADALHDCAAAVGNELILIHGRDRRLTAPKSRRDRVPESAIARHRFESPILGLAAGDFVGGRETNLAVLTDDGIIHYLDAKAAKQAALRKPTEQTETAAKSAVADGSPETLFKNTVSSELARFALDPIARVTSEATPNDPREPALSKSSERAVGNRLLRTRVSIAEKDDLLVFRPDENRVLVVVNRPRARTAEEEPVVLVATEDESEASFAHRLALATAPAPTDLHALSLNTAAPPVAVLPVRINRDALDDLIVLGEDIEHPLSVAMTTVSAVYVVTSSGDEPDADLSDDELDPPTLRAAIQNANKSPGFAAIYFNLPPDTVIPLFSRLPPVEYPTSFSTLWPDTYPLLDGGFLAPEPGVSMSGLILKNDTSVEGICVQNFPGIGISLSVAVGNNKVTDVIVFNNQGPGININSNHNQIGGLTETPGLSPGNWAMGQTGNSGNGISIVNGDHNIVQGNLLGIDFDDVPSTTTCDGIYIRGTGNQIGGTDPEARNVVCGNQRPSVDIGSGTGEGNIILGNFLGTNREGTIPLQGGTGTGIRISGHSDNTIGGTAAGAENVIGGHLFGISMSNAPPDRPITGTIIQGNLIGVGVDLSPIRNSLGVHIGEQDNLLGGVGFLAANVIGFNGTGVRTQGEAGEFPVVVAGNDIGAYSIFGETYLLGNERSGIILWGTNTVVGCPEGEAGNLVVHNGGDGILFQYVTAQDNLVVGNLIGIDDDGTTPRPNATNGIRITQGANRNIVQNNLISGNGGDGIRIDRVGANSHSNVLRSNWIGTDLDGIEAVPNGGNGVTIDDCTSNTLGREAEGEPFLIVGNAGHGIEIVGPEAAHNSITDVFIVKNEGDGVHIGRGANHNIIGGGHDQKPNTISGNQGNGIGIAESDGLVPHDNQVLYNFIGTSDDVTEALPNERNGVLVENARDNRIGLAGRMLPETVIAGNLECGVKISGPNATGNIVSGNYIGLNPGGTKPIPNRGDGIRLVNGAHNNRIGADHLYTTNIISANSGNGIYLGAEGGAPARSNNVQGNFIGIPYFHGYDKGNEGYGILIEDARENTIGGAFVQGFYMIHSLQKDEENFLKAAPSLSGLASAAIPNRIKGTGAPSAHSENPGALGNLIGNNLLGGIRIAGTRSYGNVIQGNRIGTDMGDNPHPNRWAGLWIDTPSSNTLVGGPDPESYNLVSSNGGDGICISNGEGHRILGNLIGLDSATGAASRPNAGYGIVVEDEARNVEIGGLGVDEGNVVSGNIMAGVAILGAKTSGHILRGNRIGTTADGIAALPNAVEGILVEDAEAVRIGDTAPGGGNLIAGNTGPGIRIEGRMTTVTDVWIEGNVIGINSQSDQALANQGGGIVVEGKTQGARIRGNTVSGNARTGITLHGKDSVETHILGNSIGVDSTGQFRIANQGDGIRVHGTRKTIIGGSGDDRNIVSGNSGHGISIYGEGIVFMGMKKTADEEEETLVRGNLIGVNHALAPLPNEGDGVCILDSSGNTIGPDNRIAHNDGSGVVVVALNKAEGNAILANSIYGNAKLGIDLGDNGVTPNDFDDSDAGANRLQNFPTLDVATTRTMALGPGTTPTLVLVLEGHLRSTPNTDFRLDFFGNPNTDPSGYGEGEMFLGSDFVRTSPSGTAAFAVMLDPAAYPGMRFATATATSLPANNTSEFSACARIQYAEIRTYDVWLVK